MTRNILEAVDVILEHLQEAYTSVPAPGIRHRLLVIIASVVYTMLAFYFVFVLFHDVKYF
jgi:hypothetical protein